jgi:hypothetical protein
MTASIGANEGEAGCLGAGSAIAARDIRHGLPLGTTIFRQLEE